MLGLQWEYVGERREALPDVEGDLSAVVPQTRAAGSHAYGRMNPSSLG